MVDQGPGKELRFMTSRILLRTLIVCAAMMLAAGETIACSCGSAPPVLTAYEWADTVVLARVLSVEPFEDLADIPAPKHINEYGFATLGVEKVYKGRLRTNEHFSFGAFPNAACFWSFRKESVGQRLLIYLSTINDSSWFASTCGRTRGLEYAAEDLLYLDNIEKHRGKTRVSGKYQGRWNVKFPDVANRTIRIKGEKNSYETKTDADGIFEIYDLPPGNYQLEPEIPDGWHIARYESNQTTPLKSLPFKLEAKKHVTIDVSFNPSNAVEGKVIGPNGNPLKDVCVDLLKPDQVGGNNRSDCTDENGEFQIRSLPEGSYLAVLNADGKLTPDEPFPPIFYPSVSEREKAVLVTVANGETVKGINFVVSSPGETVTVSGVLLFSNGKPVAESYVTFVPPNKDEDQSELTDVEGRFTIRVLKGLKGEVFGEFPASLGEYLKCPKLDALIKASSGKDYAEIKTPVIKVDAERDVDGLVLEFPFPKCKQKE